ncbi:unnamed protein product [Ambrosiozyma monospora]|uniref:Unnamed protein product n=1 Tax=Ambrosiozyma monospora TaxID=43982 RepID=A0ACB5U938_AMBMO|nr:unnamed protein product [Ambrosiozyma monospora]
MVAINPNNWHWVDKNCYDWSKEYFTKNLVGLKSSNEKANVEIKSLKELTGDVEVCQRKGKVISLFDLQLKLGFEGDKAKGVITKAIG